MSTHALVRRALRCWLLCFFCLLSLPTWSAEASASAESETSTVNTLPAQLNKESVADFMATLSDKEVRELLRTQLDGLSKESPHQSPPETGLLASFKQGAAVFFGSLLHAVEGLPNLASHIQNAFATWRGERADWQFLGSFFGILAIGLALGWVVEWCLARLFTRGAASPQVDQNRLSRVLWTLVVRFASQLGLLLVFYTVAEGVFESWYTSEHDMETAEVLLDLVFYARFLHMVCAFFLAPKRPELRLCALSDQHAKAVTRRLVIAGVIGASGALITEWSWEMGLPPGVSRIGFWLNLAFYIGFVWAIWRSRDAITEMLLANDENPSDARRRFAQLWPRITVVAAAVVWVLEVYVFSLPGADFDADFTSTTLLFLVILPLVDVAITALVKHLYKIPDIADSHLISARLETQKSLLRVTRVLMACVALVVLSSIWGVNLLNLASESLGVQFAGALIEIILLLLMSYLLWELVRTSIDYHLALESDAGEEEVESGSEGGEAGSRMKTLLPILRVTAAVALSVLTIIAVLSALNINIAPLLAGAGVLGLAIGFGAQTLVKDIVSGMFFLIDDAFRHGEYIDVGGIKGTVEKIALRSLRLRHHLGPQHTVPYGEIARLTNFSRDWVIMKLRFQVPHDTDVQKVKKLFKKIGAQLLEHPEFGQDFIEPFKSQGVLEVDDIGMVIRGKFMCKPGKQFVIRKEVYVQVQRAFAENGIEFARRRVEVNLPEGTTPETQKAVAAAASEAIHAALPDPAAKPV